MNFNRIARSRYSLNNTRNIPSFAVGLMNAVLTVAFWVELARSRDYLENLTDDELRDIGISRADAELEARRKFYDH